MDELCVCTGCEKCLRWEGKCLENLGRLEKKWGEKGNRMCTPCARLRDSTADPGVAAGPPATTTSRSSSSQMDQRVVTLEAPVRNLEQGLEHAKKEMQDLRECMQSGGWGEDRLGH